jgi:transposase
MQPKTCSPSFFQDYLSRRWAEGIVRGRKLFQEIKALGYTGSLSHLHRFLTKWRTSKPVASSPAPRVETIAAIDAVTGWRISPVIAASLCMKPRGMLTPRQAAKVDALKSASADFAAMRRLVMEFRGVVKSKRADKLDKWLKDATASGIYAMRRFVRTLRQDIDAVRNAITEPWSNGQIEGQINRLKTLKRSMYGRAGLELLRARMLPIQRMREHGV